MTEQPIDIRTLQGNVKRAERELQEARVVTHSSKRAVLHAADLQAETATAVELMLRSTGHPIPKDAA